MISDWRSYDEIAHSYSSIAEPLYFTRPAVDLLSLLRFSPGMKILDVGTGSGVVAAEAARVIGVNGRVVALDPALGMLLVVKKRAPRIALIAGALPRLPHRDQVFDAAVAAFVLSHVDDLPAALREIGRVLKPGGRVAVSSWAVSPGATAPGMVWEELVDRFIAKDRLQQALDTALPAEAQFSRVEAVEGALVDAGLRNVRAETRTFNVKMSTRSYMESRLISFSSRFMQSALPAHTWRDFTAQAERLLTRDFGSEIALTVAVNFGVGVR